MSKMGVEIVTNCIQKIKAVMMEDKFEKGELEAIKKVFEAGVKATDNALKKIENVN